VKHTDRARVLLEHGHLPDAMREIRSAMDDLKARISSIPDDAPITPADIQFFVNQDLAQLKPEDFEGEAINWADLKCDEVTISGDEAYIWISELSPECSKLPAFIETRMSQDTGMQCTVICEW